VAERNQHRSEEVVHALAETGVHVKISTTPDHHVVISLSMREAGHVCDELGDLPVKKLERRGSRKLIQIYKELEPLLNLRKEDP